MGRASHPTVHDCHRLSIPGAIVPYRAYRLSRYRNNCPVGPCDGRCIFTGGSLLEVSAVGCSLLILSCAALIMSFVPFLNWIALVIALPLAVIGAISSFKGARKPTAQPADKAMTWMALGMILAVVIRLAIMS